MEIYILKSTGKKIALNPKHFSPKDHLRLEEAEGFTPEHKLETPFNLETATLQELQVKFTEITGFTPKGGLKVNRELLSERVGQLISEVSAVTTEERKERFLRGLQASSDLRAAGVAGEVVLAPEATLKELNEQYLSLYNKSPGPRYSKDAAWLTKKINEKQTS